MTELGQIRSPPPDPEDVPSRRVTLRFLTQQPRQHRWSVAHRRRAAWTRGSSIRFARPQLGRAQAECAISRCAPHTPS